MTNSPEGAPDWTTISDAALESVRTATEGVKLAQELEAHAMEAWDTATPIGDRGATKIRKATVKRCTRSVTEALRILAIAHATSQSAIRSLETKSTVALMRQAEL